MDIWKIVSGKNLHFNSVCLPEWSQIYEDFQKDIWPYSYVTRLMLVFVLTFFEHDFCGGVFSHSLKKVDKTNTRKIVSIYLSYAIYLFTVTQFCKDLSIQHPKFDSNTLWEKLLSRMPECKAAKLTIDESRKQGGDPIVGLSLQLSEVAEELTGTPMKRRSRGDDLLNLPIVYMDSFRMVIDELNKGLV